MRGREHAVKCKYGVRCSTGVLPLLTHLGFAVCVCVCMCELVERPQLLGVFNYQKVTTKAGVLFASYLSSSSSFGVGVR